MKLTKLLTHKETPDWLSDLTRIITERDASPIDGHPYYAEPGDDVDDWEEEE